MKVVAVKIEIDYETADAIAVDCVRRSICDWRIMKLKEDRAYYKKYNKAAKLVIKHLGGRLK